MSITTLSFVDVETTGGHPVSERITEIGIVRVENGQVVDTWQSLVNPHQFIPEYIQQLTGITNEMVSTAPDFGDIKQEVADLLQDSILVAHNARFDYAFLKQEFQRLGVTFSVKQLCTARLSRKLFPAERHHNLSALIKRFNLSCTNRHRAFDDAVALWQLFQQWQTAFTPEKIWTECRLLLKQPSHPVHLPEALTASLPTGPGVYIMYGEAPAPLYVGKSVTVKARVMSHFQADYASAKEMKLAQQVKRIEAVCTAGELGALLKESQLIKELLPIHNRRLRRTSTLATLQLVTNTNGYHQLKVDRSPQLDMSDLSSIWGIFRSKKAALERLTELAEECHLCQKLLGLEATSGSCFGYRLGSCAGACVGKEDPQHFNLKLETALARLKMQSWPYAGKIGVNEYDPSTDLSQCHVFDRWCYLGTVTTAADLDEIRTDLTAFDLDVYKMLQAYFRKYGTQAVTDFAAVA